MQVKFPTAYTFLLCLTALLAVATWVMPAGYYQYQEADGSIVSYQEKSNKATPITGSYIESAEQKPQGLMGILQAPIKGFYDAKDIIVFVLIFGGFIKLAADSGAVNTVILTLVKKLKGRVLLMIPLIMVLFGLGGMKGGMGEELVVFFPLVIPIMLAAGYDKMTATAMILLGAGIGVWCSIINPFATGIGSEAAGVTIADGMFLRAIQFLISVPIGVAFVMHYAIKVKKNPSSSYVFHSLEAKKKKVPTATLR